MRNNRGEAEKWVQLQSGVHIYFIIDLSKVQSLYFFFTLLTGTFDMISLPGAVCDLLCEGLVLSPSLLALI